MLNRSSYLSDIHITPPRIPNANASRSHPTRRPKNTWSENAKTRNPSSPVCYIILLQRSHNFTFSASSLNCAAFLSLSYLADVSPLHMVPSNESQNVKKGWEKLVLIPQL